MGGRPIRAEIAAPCMYRGMPTGIAGLLNRRVPKHALPKHKNKH
jgi:hypothetical protein